MSRIGKQPIQLPEGVSVAEAGGTPRSESVSLLRGRVTVVGPKGTLSLILRPEVGLRIEAKSVRVEPVRTTRKTPAYWGLTRSLLARMAEGVSRGFTRKLEIEGIGYRASLEGASLLLALGFSHPVRVLAPEGIVLSVEKNVITVSGIDPVLVGDVAAGIRRLRPPEPYKGKGIRYAGEIIRRKAGKKAVSTGG